MSKISPISLMEFSPHYFKGIANLFVVVVVVF